MASSTQRDQVLLGIIAALAAKFLAVNLQIRSGPTILATTSDGASSHLLGLKDVVGLLCVPAILSSLDPAQEQAVRDFVGRRSICLMQTLGTALHAASSFVDI